MHPGDRDPRGELVRPFAMTRGRAQPVDDLALEAILTTTARGRQEAPYAGHDRYQIAQLCQHPHSLAEISAHLRIPLGVANLLVTDMIDEQLLDLHRPTTDDDNPDDRMHMLERVLHGLRRL